MKSRIVRPTKTCAPCRPVRREEDRRERVVVRREAHARVLDHLRQQERQAHQERQHEPGLQARAVAAADRLQRPVDGEARRDEDRRVDAGDVARKLEALGRPRVAVDDADEEVRREERAEEHDLRRDEEQHPEHGGADARALVRDGRAVMVLGGRGVARLNARPLRAHACARRSAARAARPGTPYSYGLPITCGISSKLKIGGGDVTCHSSVSARHGFPGAGGPYFHEWIML